MIKSEFTTNCSPNKPIQYPILMKSASSSAIVLMTGEGTGIVVHGTTDSNKDVGHISYGWNMAFLIPLKNGDEVVLRNIPD